MNTHFSWEEPPPNPRKPSGTYRVANKTAIKLAKNPGKWACIGVYKSYWSAQDRASRIRTGKVLGFKNVGTFKTEVRRTNDGYKLFAQCTYVKAAMQEGLQGYNVRDDDGDE